MTTHINEYIRKNAMFKNPKVQCSLKQNVLLDTEARCAVTMP